MNDKKGKNQSILLEPNNSKKNGIKLTGATSANAQSAAHADRLVRFNSRQGHGYAAEQANHLIDLLEGKNSTILGDDNAKNGPDRIVNGQLIQTKYHQNAASSVQAAFRDGVYRYYRDGKPMSIEVPPEQYDAAVKLMKKRIVEGKVPGVTNPDEAEDLVKAGNITYEQAKNIAKAGNIDSLKFDAYHGIVSCANTIGITATIAYAKALWEGKDITTSVDQALCAGLQMGGLAFITSVVTAQLTRTSLNKLLLKPSLVIAKKLPSFIRNALKNALRKGVAIYGAAATKNLAHLLRSNAIANAVTFLCLSSNDICKVFNGKISGKQLFKNLMELAGSIAGSASGSVGGATLGGLIGGLMPFPGGAAGGAKIGFWIGGALGGVGGDIVTKKVMNKFIEDDAIAMVRIIEDRFAFLAQEYLLSYEELDIIVEELRENLSKTAALIEMFASKNRKKYAEDMLLKIINKTICHRGRISFIPQNNFLITELNKILDLNNEEILTRVMYRAKGINVVKLGEQLTGRTLTPLAAKKALYVAKQENMKNIQAEMIMISMVDSNQKTAMIEKTLRAEIANKQLDLSKFLGDDNNE